MIMKYILFKPLSGVIEQRKAFLEKNAKTTADSKKKAQIVLELKDKEIQNARMEGSKVVKATLEDANKQKQEALINAKNQAKLDLEQASGEILTQCESAKQELKCEIESFVNTIASKVLEKEVNIRLDEEKINSVINPKGGQNA